MTLHLRELRNRVAFSTLATCAVTVLAVLLPMTVHAQATRNQYDGEYLEEFGDAYNYYYHEDFESALPAFLKLAVLGDATSQWFVGWMYANGEGTRQDYDKAIRWYTSSAEAGFGSAMLNLGSMIEYGEGVSQDYQKALEWFELARDAGHPYAQDRIDSVLKKIAASTRQARQTSDTQPDTAYEPPLQIGNKPHATSSQAPQKPEQSASAREVTLPERRLEQPSSTGVQNYPSKNTGAERIGSKGLEGAIVGAALGLISFLIYFVRVLFRKAKEPTVLAAKKMVAQSSAALRKVAKSDEEKLLSIDDEFFTKASREIEESNQIQGLWLKSLSLAEGDEEKQKAMYMRLRAKQLSES